MKRFMSAFTILALLMMFSFVYDEASATGTATVPLSITVNGACTVTDASTDTMAGSDPTLNVTLSVTPDVGETDATDTAAFRIRTNLSMWTLSAQRAGFMAGTTGLTAGDVALDITKTAGSNGVAAACALQAPFTGSTDISSISDSSATTICAGTAKTAAAASSSANTNNYIQIDTDYSVPQDFFFEPGTASDTITYSVTNP